jgi:hypothetical protein
MDSYISHNLKKISTGETAYYPYSIFSSRGYIVNPKIESRLKYRFRSVYITSYSILFLALFISLFRLNIFYTNRIFPLFFIMMIVFIPFIASYNIKKSICRNLEVTNEKLTFRERFKSTFYPNRKALTWSIIMSLLVVVISGAILMFSNNPIDHVWRLAVLAILIIFYRLIF